MIIWVPKIYGLCHTSNEPTVGGITKINMSMKGGFHLHSQVIYLNVWLFLFSAVKMYVVPHVIPSLWTALQFSQNVRSSIRLLDLFAPNSTFYPEMFANDTWLFLKHMAVFACILSRWEPLNPNGSIPEGNKLPLLSITPPLLKCKQFKLR